MKLKLKTKKNPEKNFEEFEKNNYLENKNFLNSQNYILGKNKKLKIKLNFQYLMYKYFNKILSELNLIEFFLYTFLWPIIIFIIVFTIIIILDIILSPIKILFDLYIPNIQVFAEYILLYVFFSYLINFFLISINKKFPSLFLLYTFLILNFPIFIIKLFLNKNNFIKIVKTRDYDKKIIFNKKDKIVMFYNGFYAENKKDFFEKLSDI